LLLLLLAVPSMAQEAHLLISADRLGRLASVGRIDFADFPWDINIGWFEANDSATEFVVFDNDANIHILTETGVIRSWSYVTQPSEQVFALIDAVYLDEAPLVLYLLDEHYFINNRQLEVNGRPVGIHRIQVRDSLFVEVVDENGDTSFWVYSAPSNQAEWMPLEQIPYPIYESSEALVKVGRIDFPLAIRSSLSDGSLHLNAYPNSFTADSGAEYRLKNGPAVFGAVNRRATHFAWSAPRSTLLNLLDLRSGANRIVAALDGAYAQYYLLGNDADAIIAVNLDFEPHVAAWDASTGQRFDLGRYRTCGRIPDKAALSEDGTALVIGCDSGLDIWRIVDEGERNR